MHEVLLQDELSQAESLSHPEGQWIQPLWGWARSPKLWRCSEALGCCYFLTRKRNHFTVEVRESPYPRVTLAVTSKSKRP